MAETEISENRRLFAENWLPLLYEVNGRESSNEPLLLWSSSTVPVSDGVPFTVVVFAARRVVMCNGSVGPRTSRPGTLLALITAAFLSLGDI